MKSIRLVIDRQTAKWTEMVAEDETTIRLPSAWLPEGSGVNEVVTLFCRRTGKLRPILQWKSHSGVAS